MCITQREYRVKKIIYLFYIKTVYYFIFLHKPKYLFSYAVFTGIESKKLKVNNQLLCNLINNSIIYQQDALV